MNIPAFEVNFTNLKIYILILRIAWSALGFMQTLVSLSAAESFIVIAYNFDLDLVNNLKIKLVNHFVSTLKLLYTTSFEFYDLAIFMKVGKFPTITKEIKYK